MAQDIKIAVTGAGGRMGRTLIRLIAETDGLTLSGGIEAEGSPHLGGDLGTLAGLAKPLGIAAMRSPSSRMPTRWSIFPCRKPRSNSPRSAPRPASSM